MNILAIIIVILLVLFSAYLSAMETAVTATSLGKIQQLKSKGVSRTDLLLKLIKNKEQIISTLLTANSIVNTIATTIATSIAISVYGDNLGTIVSSVVMSIIIIIFAEVTPKAIAVSQAETIALFSVNAMRLLLTMLAPISISLSYITSFFCYIFGIDLNNKVSGAEEIRGLIEHQHREAKVFDKIDRDMLGGVLDIKNMEVSEIMVHRSRMYTINFDLPRDKLITQVINSPYTRIPIWKESSDNVIGVLCVRELVKALYASKLKAEEIDLKDYIVEPWFIPENALVTNQLRKFKQKYSNIALVVDEYGVLQGMITRQDILEEIVGPVFDNTTNNIIKIDETTYIINGSSSIREVNRELNWNLPDDDATTIAGLIIHQTQKIPKQGDKYYLCGLQISIEKANAHYIQLVKVKTISINNNNM